VRGTPLDCLVKALLNDLRYSVRSLARTPVLTAALLATVAVGTGAHATVSAFVNGLLTSHPAWARDARLVEVHWRDASGAFTGVPRERYETLRARSEAFDTVAAFRQSHASASLDAGRGVSVSLVRATPSLWNVLPLPAVAADPRAADAPGVVIGDRFWRSAFDARPDVTGTGIRIDGRPYRVAAVVPESFDGIYLGRSVDIWIPQPPDDITASVHVLGRLRRGRTVADAQGEAAAGVEGPAPVAMPFMGIEPDAQIKLEELRRLLAAAAMLVFVTAAANVAGFLLSRATRRSHETAARVALGATPRQLASQIAADSIVISVAGGLFGALVAWWIAGALPALLYREDAARLRLAADPAQIAATAGGYTAIMLVCALAPLAQIRKAGSMTVLRRGDGVGMPVRGLRTLLAVAQMGVCVVLVIGAASVMQAFRDAARTVRAATVGQPVIAVMESAAQYARPDVGLEYFREAKRAVDAASGVGQTALVATLPGGRAAGATYRIEMPEQAIAESAIRTSVPDGKGLVGLTIVAGRGFDGGDGPRSCRVALVNQRMAEVFFGGDAVGRSIRDADGRRTDIVGVAEPKQGATVEDDPLVYLYSRQTGEAPGAAAAPRRYLLRRSAPFGAAVDLDVNIASPEYFAAVGAPFVAGSGFGADTADGCATAVVNREAASEYFAGSAVGGALIAADGSRVEITGVVDAGPLRIMQRRTDAMVYLPWEQHYAPRMTLIAVTPLATPERIADITARVNGIAGANAPPEVGTLEAQLARTALGPERVGAAVIACSAVVALALGLLGVSGVMSDTVLQRRRDIALRLALGARAGGIVATVLRHGLRIAAAGGAAGLAVAWIAVCIVMHAHPDVHAPALWMWLACPAVLVTVVLLATIAPARWALAVDPMTITREG
jgi:hypothetical protein